MNNSKHALPRIGIEKAPEPTWEIYTVDDVFMKQMPFLKAGYIVKQHSHDYDHGTLVACGAVRVWVDEKFVGDFYAPTCITIEAGKLHTIMSLEDNTLAYCIHNVMRNGEVEITSHYLSDIKES